jgi:serine/threonine-protein kinase
MVNLNGTLQIAHYKVNSVLKKDDHSAVYLAEDIKSGEIVILKTLKTDGLPDPSIITRFKRESRLLESLSHPGIISAIDSGSHENLLYITFEYFESKNLRTLLQEGIKGNESRFLIVKQLFSALKNAHENKIVHRDLKPENILIAEDGHLKIGDFGLATGGSENFVTSQFSVVGTPGYMSPEQILGQKLTIKSDLFSAGIVIYELFDGKNPFIGKDVNETLNNIINFTDESLNEKCESFPQEIVPILKILLKKNEPERDDSVYSLVEKLPGENIYYSPNRRIKIKKSYIYASLFLMLFISTVFLLNNIFKVEESDNNNQVVNKFINHDSSLSMINLEELESAENFPLETNTAVNNTKLDEIENNKVEKLDNISAPEINHIKLNGELSVDCLPWATVYIDSMKYETTPLKENISLPVGSHKVRLINPGYPVYVTEVNIKEGVVTRLKVNLESMVGYLDCKIFPWGEIYINGEYKGATPLNRPLILNPGDYKVLLKNKEYPDAHFSVKILQNETYVLKHNFNKIN